MPFWSLRRILVYTAILLMVVAGIILALHPAIAKRWLANRYAARAEVLYKRGSHEATRIAVNKALALDPDCARALKALLPELSDDPNGTVLVRSRLADLEAGDQENLRALALLATYSGHYNVAAKSIGELERSKAKPTEVLELRSRLHAAEGDFQEAGQQARLLLQLDPGNPVGRLIHALAQIHGAPGADRAAAEKELRELLPVGALTLEALRGLRHLAVLRKDFAGASEFSASIVANPLARFDDWLIHGEIGFRQQPGRLEEILADLTGRAGADPVSLALVSKWLCTIGHAGRVGPWVDSSKALQSIPSTAQMIRADTLVVQKAWPELNAFIEPLNWGRLEYYRLALLSRALREQQKGFTEPWGAATEAALRSSRSTIQLCDTIANWPGWEDERVDFLWRAQKKKPENLKWALSSLSAQYQAAKNTPGLLRVYEEFYRAFPSNLPIQNNLAFYSLLLNRFVDRSCRIADSLFLASPQEPEIVSTYTLGLIRRSEYKRALEVISKLPPEALKRNDIAPYYAAALAANGQAEAARKLRDQINQSELLPEESELLKFD